MLQDYNEAVLAQLTAFNVAANQVTRTSQVNLQTDRLRSSSQPPEGNSSASASADQGHDHDPPWSASATCRYFSGDWAAMPAFLDDQGLTGTYDLVVSAETIYNEQSQQALHDCILKVSALLEQCVRLSCLHAHTYICT